MTKYGVTMKRKRLTKKHSDFTQWERGYNAATSGAKLARRIGSRCWRGFLAGKLAATEPMRAEA